MRASVRLCGAEKQLRVRSEPSGFGSQKEWNSEKNYTCINKENARRNLLARGVHLLSSVEQQ